MERSAWELRRWYFGSKYGLTLSMDDDNIKIIWIVTGTGYINIFALGVAQLDYRRLPHLTNALIATQSGV